jgi:hypothetical protein
MFTPLDNLNTSSELKNKVNFFLHPQPYPQLINSLTGVSQVSYTELSTALFAVCKPTSYSWDTTLIRSVQDQCQRHGLQFR